MKQIAWTEISYYNNEACRNDIKHFQTIVIKITNSSASLDQ